MKKTANFKYGKLLLDLILLLFLALMYQKRAISMEFHESGGLVLCGLFLLHKALNWQWIRAVTAGICRRKVKINLRWAVDVLLLSMTAVLVTGLLIAKTLPTAIAGARWLRPWHFSLQRWPSPCQAFTLASMQEPFKVLCGISSYRPALFALGSARCCSAWFSAWGAIRWSKRNFCRGSVSRLPAFLLLWRTVMLLSLKKADMRKESTPEAAIGTARGKAAAKDWGLAKTKARSPANKSQ